MHNANLKACRGVLDRKCACVNSIARESPSLFPALWIMELENWKTLGNTPVDDLSWSFAVRWRDFITVVDHRYHHLLYDVKWNMWSQLSTLPFKLAGGRPLTCFNDKLLALAQDGTLYEFLPETGQWKVNKTLDRLPDFQKM